MSINIIYFAIVSITLIIGYIRVANLYNIVAVPNHRSLHDKKIAKGGGLAIYLIYIIGNLLFIDFGVYTDTLFYLFFITFAVLFGFVDDCNDLSAKKRLILQILIAILPSVYMCRAFIGLNNILIYILWLFVILFTLVWFINLINFIDGTNGMASFMGIYITFVSLIFLKEVDLDINLKLSLILLGISYLCILPFNFPAPRVFIGDSGTNLFSVSMLVIMISTITFKPVNVIYWGIAFSYYLTDTSTTTFIRLLKFKFNFYKPHRSHAYQNCAREWKSHGKILFIIICINLLWVTPILLIAINYTNLNLKILCMVICYIPLIIFSLYKGPLNSAH